MTGLTALPSLMPTLIPWTFTSILLILAVLVVRKFTQNWLSSVNRYALWLVVLIRLLVIACKLCIIFCLWWLFFSPEHRTTVTPDKMGDAIFSSAPSEVQTPPAKR